MRVAAFWHWLILVLGEGSAGDWLGIRIRMVDAEVVGLGFNP
jgi:hypothetical protein